MQQKQKLTTVIALIVALASAGAWADDVELESAGPIAFGPAGVLLVADPMAAKIYAFETGDDKAHESETKAINIEGIDSKMR